MKTPAFRYMGGKARLRARLINCFPKSGYRYVEPFAGVGNVYFQARKELNFEQWHLSDINPFLYALTQANLDEMPEKVEKNDFVYWKNANNYIAKIIEPRITFAGKGYRAGFDNSFPPRYNGKLYKNNCEEAKKLLLDATIKNIGWEEWNYEGFGENDFIYFDPPYFNTKASYPNINHEKLIETLNKAKFRWAISGYKSDLYKALKSKKIHEFKRNSEIKGSNSGHSEEVSEILWMN